MSTVRPPAVAGLFYPDDPGELSDAVRGFLDAVPTPRADAAAPHPKALIAPHAGYVYSGPIAASAYGLLAGARDRIRRVVLLGPAHRVQVAGLAAPSVDAFETPLGAVPISREAIERVAALPQVEIRDDAHAQEHSLEVHLPFLQEILREFDLAPFVVGGATPAEVAQVLDALWGGSETLVVVSSDLSHYESYETARRMDEATTRAIEALRPDDIDFEQACGRIPVQGLLLCARSRQLRARTLDLRSSGDTAGSRDAVVGYGSYAVG